MSITLIYCAWDWTYHLNSVMLGIISQSGTLKIQLCWCTFRAGTPLAFIKYTVVLNHCLTLVGQPSLTFIQMLFWTCSFCKPEIKETKNLGWIPTTWQDPIPCMSRLMDHCTYIRTEENNVHVELHLKCKMRPSIATTANQIQKDSGLHKHLEQQWRLPTWSLKTPHCVATLAII